MASQRTDLINRLGTPDMLQRALQYFTQNLCTKFWRLVNSSQQQALEAMTKILSNATALSSPSPVEPNIVPVEHRKHIKFDNKSESILCMSYLKNDRPKSAEYTRLSRVTDLTPKQIQTW